jgi:DNA/RNA endonuclease YhcR with UshA esterase domain
MLPKRDKNASNRYMRTCLLILAIFAFTFELSAEETNNITLLKTNSFVPLKIGAADATNYYDREMIVTGKVARVTIRPSVTFLNLDKPFPDSPFTVVIIHGHSNYFGDANALKGKSIEIRGKIKNYHDKPEIALDSTNQLTVLSLTNSIILTNGPAIPLPTNAPSAMQSTNSFPEIM